MEIKNNSNRITDADAEAVKKALNDYANNPHRAKIELPQVYEWAKRAEK